MGPIEMTYLRSFMTIVGLILIVEYRVRGHIMKARAKKMWSLTGTAYQSSTHHGYGPWKALEWNENNDVNKGECAHTAEEQNPYWYVVFADKIRVQKVDIRNRGGQCCNKQFGDVFVYVSDHFNKDHRNSSEMCGNGMGGNQFNGQVFTFDCNNLVGKYVIIFMMRYTYMVLCTVWVWGDLVCDAGFKDTKDLCVDIDECSKPELNDCKPRTTCKNTVGSYECECQLGYTLQGDDCLFNDVCKTSEADDVNKCPEKEVCVPILNAHSCECVDGYERKDKICEDIDECNQDVPVCPANRSCENLEGGYVCKLKNDKVERDCVGPLMLI